MRTLRNHRGVSLIEGLVASVILLTGMVGVLQGLAIASVQNSMANRHTRASVIAQELMGSIEQQGRARLIGAGGLFASGQCQALTSLLPATQDFKGDLSPLPASLSAFTTNCFIDFDALGTAFTKVTPGYSAADDFTFTRLVAVYQAPALPDGTNPVMYVGVNVGWRDGGRVRIVKRFTAIYDTSTNETNLEF